MLSHFGICPEHTCDKSVCVCICVECGFYVFEWQPCKVDLDLIAWLCVRGFWCNNTENCCWHTHLLWRAEMLRKDRRHSCLGGDLESVLALANISAASCTVCTFESWCVSLHVELILPGNQQFVFCFSQLQNMKQSFIGYSNAIV